jgi:hypothetical protein
MPYDVRFGYGACFADNKQQHMGRSKQARGPKAPDGSKDSRASWNLEGPRGRRGLRRITEACPLAGTPSIL